MTKHEYKKLISRLGREYEPKMRHLLRQISTELRNLDANLYLIQISPPFSMTDDEYRWDILVRPGIMKPQSFGFLPRVRGEAPGSFGTLPAESFGQVSISLTLTESLVREGQDADEDPETESNIFGVSFLLDVIAEGGQILYSLAPFNYSPRCWVSIRDQDAIKQRWREIEDNLSVPSIAYAILHQNNESEPEPNGKPQAS